MKKKLLLVLPLLLSLLAAGWFVLRPSSPWKPTPGGVLPVPPVAVNLAGGGYLRVGVALQLTTDAADGKTLSPDRITDLVIAEYSMAKPADVLASRDALKADLEKKVEAAYPRMCMGLYLTSYVTQ